MAIRTPLTEQDFESIKTNLKRLDELDEDLRLASQAGIDVVDSKAQAKESRAQLNRLRQTYFPNRV